MTKEAEPVKIADLHMPIRELSPVDDLSKLAADIKKKGVLKPITLTVDNRLIDGLRRIKASCLVGLEEIPAIRAVNLADLMEVLPRADDASPLALPFNKRWLDLYPLWEIIREYGSRDQAQRRNTAGWRKGYGSWREPAEKKLGLSGDHLDDVRYVQSEWLNRDAPDWAYVDDLYQKVRRNEIGIVAARYRLKFNRVVGEISKPADQKQALVAATAQLSATLGSLSKLGVRSAEFPAEEWEEALAALADTNSKIKNRIRNLRNAT